jgi:hypothetical protein
VKSFLALGNGRFTRFKAFAAERPMRSRAGAKERTVSPDERSETKEALMSKARDTQKTVKKKSEKTLKEKRKEKKEKKSKKG